MEAPSVDVDNIIDRLLEVRGSKPGQQVDLEEHEIRYLCSKARSIFIKQPILLELEAPIKVCFFVFLFFFHFVLLYFYHFVVILSWTTRRCVGTVAKGMDNWIEEGRETRYY